MKFKRILVANRGEIAVRVMNTCREMGIETVAVYSDVDRQAIHTLKADRRVPLGPPEPSESYLNIDKIISAALETGAEAIHPGYGFLSENHVFAKRCEDEGIVFIGPPSSVIRDLGDKITARRIMVGGGVPVVPGITKEEPDSAALKKEADRIGYPILIKASAGGGGKGIRIVYDSAELKEAAVSASNEALAAFGNGAIYLEKFLPKARHIEFQILADSHGNIVHVLERECSIQRRHQKIIEESPSTIMTPELRREMGKAAVAAARASGYVNAGTVEFLVDDNKNFYFLEVNTRLQVEHPVTEMITGIDMVRRQIEIASGDRLPFRQEDIVGRGHSIECRIYAEDPENGFFPSPGKITYMREPSGAGVRNDCGIYSGFEVPYEYDPILSKLIVHAENRQMAISRMDRALEEYVILGIKTPIPFLLDIIRSGAFKRGETFTDFIAANFPDWKAGHGESDLAAVAYIVNALARKPAETHAPTGGEAEPSPWRTLGGWRM